MLALLHHGQAGDTVGVKKNTKYTSFHKPLTGSKICTCLKTDVLAQKRNSFSFILAASGENYLSA